MLTPDGSSAGGQLTTYECGSRHKELYEFLQRSAKDEHRGLPLLRHFFKSSRYPYTPYRDSEILSHSTRGEYFQRIPEEALHESLVFLDPDNGLEVPSMGPKNGNKYLRYEELKMVFSRMDSSSILMVYQHIPRVNRPDFFLEVAHKMTDLVQPQHISLISDNSIAFFFITKSADTGWDVDGILKRYASKTIPKLCFLVPGAGVS